MTTETLPKPRKTPRQARSAATVDAILEAAAHILETGGLEAYTTNAVAVRACVSIGSLYQYFPNKDAITAALVLRDSEDMAARLEGVLADFEDQPLIACIDALIEETVSHQLDRPVLARLMDIEEHRLGRDPRLEAAHDRIVQVVRSLLERSGLDLPFDMETATEDLFSIAHGISDSAGMRGETDRSLLRARIRHSVLSYLGVPPS
ncbi:MAG: TetR/AcrR family transcriptional regulator [Hyphomonas sp.]